MDSNHGPARYKLAALTAELCALRKYLFLLCIFDENRGAEPQNPCFHYTRITLILQETLPAVFCEQ